MGTPYSGPFPHTNAGTISGIEVSGSTFTGNVANSGTISTSGIGVSDSALTNGVLYNQGTIDGGVSVFGSTITGSVYGIENLTGTINGGISVSGSTITGDVYNDGTITGGISVSGDATIGGGIITLESLSGGISLDSATVGGIGAGGDFTGGISIDTASEVSRSVFAVEVTGPTFTDGITNAGTISANTSALWIFNVTEFSGGITNSGTISAAGGYAVNFQNDQTISGGLTNSGSIVGGVHIESVQTFAGSIVNASTGTITGSNRGIEVSGVTQFGVNSAGGGIVNSGTIDVTGSAIDIGGVGVSTFFGGITNSGTISDGGFIPYGAINVSAVSSFVGDISNSGTIEAPNGAGIDVHGVANFLGSIVNSDTISAFRGGILVGGSQATNAVSYFSGGITNSGAITGGALITYTSGSYYAYYGQSIRVEDVGDFLGGVVNTATGSMFGDVTGVAVSDSSGSGTFSGGISNSGTISADAWGVKVEGYATFQGGIVNQTGGTISAGAGIVVESATSFDGGITNSGAITAAGVGIALGDVSTFTGDVSNSGTISVAASGPFGSPTGISVGDVGDFAGDIANSGSITAGVGIAVVSNVNFTGNNADGDIVNSSSGTITAARTGILVSNGGATSTAFGTNASGGGAIVNAGTISVTGATSPFGPGAPGRGIAVRGSVAFTSGTSSRSAGISVFDGNITNAGTIKAAGTGVFVGNTGTTPGTVAISTFDGSITNSGTISAGNGILLNDIATFSGDIVNGANGQIVATSGDGIEVGQSAVGRGYTYTPGTGANPGTSGTYSSYTYQYTKPVGTFLGSIVNHGTISAAVGVGIKLSSVAQFSGTDPRGDIVNTGTISGSIGIELVNTPDVSVFDSGVITGTGGTAIQFHGGATSDNTLTLAAGYTITGDVLGGGTDTLQLGGTGAASFDLSDVGTTYTGFTTFDVIGGTWTTTGSGLDWNVEGGTLEVSGSVTDTTVDAGGTLEILSGGTADPTTVDAGGSETIDSNASDTGALVYGTQYVYGSATDSTAFAGGRVVVENGGSISGAVISGGTVEVVSGGNAGSSITFATDSGTLQIDGPNTPGVLLAGTTISGFVPGDTIDLTGIDYSTPNSVFVNGSDQLQITEGGNTYEIQLTGDFTGDTFHLAPDNGGAGLGTEITETPCYCPGTLIRTDSGEARVEELKIGDRVMTASGETRPIKWIGRRSYSGRFVMGRNDILPVCIKAGALDDNVPKRDLWISPNHAMYFKEKHLDGMLIEARDLINGVSVVQAESVESIEYVHIELETHDVIIAEGALAESFIDDDSRFLFHNAPEYRLLYPDNAKEAAQYCAPRQQEGYEVEAVRRRIAMRAGARTSDDEPRVGALRGYVDRITAECVAGWAQNLDHPEAPVCLDIFAGGELIGRVLANRYREDLESAGRGSGYHSFAFMPPPGLAFTSEEIDVRRSLDGVTLELTADAWRMLRQSTGRQRAA